MVITCSGCRVKAGYNLFIVEKGNRSLYRFDCKKCGSHNWSFIRFYCYCKLHDAQPMSEAALRKLLREGKK